MERIEFVANDAGIQACWEACLKDCEQAEEILREQGDYSVLSDCARNVLYYCENFVQYDFLINQAYTASKRIAECIYEHPRLLLQIKQVQLEALQEAELQSGHPMNITDDLRAELSQLHSNIQAADEGRFADIKIDSVLKRDPVEWTKAFEDVVDEVEHEVYEQLIDIPRGMGFCFAYWAARREAFQKRGIEWRSPHQMNPRVMFD